MVMQMHSLLSSSEISLRYEVSDNFASAEEVIFILHGRGEWIEKFYRLIEALQLPSNIAWASWDHRGQGGSGGARSHISSYDDFANDTEEMVRFLSHGRPYSFICHSMGSLIALYSALKGKVHPKKLFLLSPLLNLPPKPIPHSIGRPLMKYATKLGLGQVNLGFDKHINIPFAGNRLTHDPEIYQQILNYPFKWYGPTFNWIYATIVATDYIHSPEALRNLHIETHIIHGSDERVVDPKSFQHWHHLAQEEGKRDVHLLTITGARHELHSESKDFFDPTAAYLRKELGLIL